MRETNRRRKPTTPGEILREEFLIPLGMTQRQLADHLGCDVKVVNRIVNGRSSVTAEMALKLGAAFRTTPDFWINAQQAVDLHHAVRRLPSLPKPVLRAVAEYARHHGRSKVPRSLGAAHSGRRDLSERSEELLKGMGRPR